MRWLCFGKTPWWGLATRVANTHRSLSNKPAYYCGSSQSILDWGLEEVVRSVGWLRLAKPRIEGALGGSSQTAFTFPLNPKKLKLPCLQGATASKLKGHQCSADPCPQEILHHLPGHAKLVHTLCRYGDFSQVSEMVEGK